MEVILAIEEVFHLRKKYEDYAMTYEGYKVTTDAQEILVLVSDGEACCENFGAVISEDDVHQFIGAELLSVKIVDSGINEKMLAAGSSLDEGDVVFVNLETNRGTFQLAVYNAHNGYYGHSAIVESKQISKGVTL